MRVRTKPALCARWGSHSAGLSRESFGGIPGNCLALAELEALAGTGLAGLFAFLHARVTRQQALGLQRAAEFGADLQERAGDAKADCAGLATDSAAGGIRGDVLSVAALRDFKRLQDQTLKGGDRKVVVVRTSVDEDFSRPGREAHACSGGLAASDGGNDGFCGHDSMFCLGNFADVHGLLRGVRVLTAGIHL